jgi:hypothetical protein
MAYFLNTSVNDGAVKSLRGKAREDRGVRRTFGVRRNDEG